MNEVSILIGMDLAFAFAPSEIKKSTPNSPLGLLTPYGWCLMGPTCGIISRSMWAAFASFEDGHRMEEQLQQMFKIDFPEHASERKGLSQDDHQAEEILKETSKFVDGRYEVGLLWKHRRDTIASMLQMHLRQFYDG